MDRHLVRYGSRLVVVLLVVVGSWCVSGCSTHHVYQIGGPGGREQANQPSTEWESKTVNTYLWGAVNRQDVTVENCTLGSGARTGIEEIKITTNFGQATAMVLTLGIWKPMRISWRCAKPVGDRGTLGDDE